ncbi:hypothetical protein HUT19_31975 [Streptomyces sp. NA02950]|uniref:hypothetical protein n=1 Tax=Streptomyces sp. NA02950 TaxID=2742137 RepID=UPI0015925279|nr:hypothetical protein [Streptomyces sp. NA02950]QKV95790.1 hypothetical protein HUT19_31975 [Streptomyces sp. NA02950]
MTAARRWRSGMLLAAGTAALVVLLTTCTGRPGEGEGPRGTATVTTEPPHRHSAGDSSIPSTAPAKAPRAGRTAERTPPGRRVPRNQHLMGWGADNPEPSPGHGDSAAPDRRVALMRRTRAAPVLTLSAPPTG